MRRRLRSATDMLSASRVVFMAARNPSAARSPPTLRIRSAKTGSNSTQWPSPSITGWSRLERIWAGERWPFELMCLPPRTGGLWAEAYHRVSGRRVAGLSISRALVRPMGEDPFFKGGPDAQRYPASHAVPVVRQPGGGGGQVLHVGLPELEDPGHEPVRRRDGHGRRPAARHRHDRGLPAR